MRKFLDSVAIKHTQANAHSQFMYRHIYTPCVHVQGKIVRAASALIANNPETPASTAAKCWTDNADGSNVCVSFFQVYICCVCVCVCVCVHIYIHIYTRVCVYVCVCLSLFQSIEREVNWVCGEVQRCKREGVPLRQMAVLFRHRAKGKVQHPIDR